MKEKISLTKLTKKNRDFLGRDLINKFDSEKIIEIKKQWNKFIEIFWVLFLLKIISKGNGAIEDQNMAILLSASQFLVIILMVILMGYYSYKFSGKKSYWLCGLFGLFWFLIVGIFIGFWQVMRLKNQKIKDNESQ